MGDLVVWRFDHPTMPPTMPNKKDTNKKLKIRHNIRHFWLSKLHRPCNNCQTWTYGYFWCLRLGTYVFISHNKMSISLLQYFKFYLFIASHKFKTSLQIFAILTKPFP